jgi:hypothetical protein
MMKLPTVSCLHTAWLFPSDNDLGVPCLHHTPISHMPSSLVAYRRRIQAEPWELAQIGIHFFLDDHRFETVWTRPMGSLEALSQHQMVLTPDFSLYYDWPRSLHIWNTYRNRWCGAFWQAHGFTVIPTISWAGPESYDFCFLGVPPNSVVAVSTVGVKLERPLEYQLFLDGFQEMVARLRPSHVLCYGKAPTVCRELVAITEYETRWQSIRQERFKTRCAAYGG